MGDDCAKSLAPPSSMQEGRGKRTDGIREPEIAFIDQAELVVTLKRRESLALAADNPKLASLDGDYLRMLWGDALDNTFSLPKDIYQEGVVESRFSVIGYYLRYSSLMAKSITDEPSTRRSSPAVMTIHPRHPKLSLALARPVPPGADIGQGAGPLIKLTLVA